MSEKSECNNAAAEAGEENDKNGGMPSKDVEFLIACLQNCIGGEIKIDIEAVAKARNMSNPRSVSNRMAVMRKKYGFPIGGRGKTAGEKNGDNDDDAGEAVSSPSKVKVPTTPIKTNRVTKKTPTRGPRKSTPKKSKAVKAEDEDEGDEDEALVKSDLEEDKEQLDVESPTKTKRTESEASSTVKEETKSVKEEEMEDVEV